MSYIYNLTDTWNAAGTTFAGIKMAVTNTASSASSNLLDLSVSGATTASFFVNKFGAVVATSSSATALAIGANGSTNPAFTVDASVASSATGIKITSAAAAAGAAISVTSSGTNENLSLDAKGSGVIAIGATSTGNIGLGTSSPFYKVGFNGDAGTQFIGLNRRTTADSAGNNLNFVAGAATVGATNKNGGNVIFNGGTSTGTGKSEVQFWVCPAGASGTSDNTLQPAMVLNAPSAGNVYVGINTQTPANNIDINVGNAGIRFGLLIADGYYDIGRDSTDGYFKFNGAQTTFVGYKFFITGAEQARIDNSGNLLLGYTTSNGAYRLQVNSQIFATSATIATSDARYKENIKPLTGALAMVQALNPVSFDWKSHPIHAFDTANNTVGFLAQEVESALADKPFVYSIVKASECVLEPEVLDENLNVIKPAVTEPFLGIAEGNMVAILTAAIKELKAEFDAYVTAQH